MLASFGFTALFTASSLFAGRAADTLDRAKVIVIGAASWSIAGMLQSVATSFDSVLGLRALTGISQAFLNPQVHARYAKEQRLGAAVRQCKSISRDFHPKLFLIKRPCDPSPFLPRFAKNAFKPSTPSSATSDVLPTPESRLH